jgi:hypothetical protein
VIIKEMLLMVGTVVDYSDHNSSVHFIKILSGEKVCEIYPDSFPEDVRLGMQVEFNTDNYVLVDCGLIHKYLINKEDIEKIENETFYTVDVLNDLIEYEVKEEANKLVFSNGSETLAFRKVDTDKYLNYILDEF